MSGYKNPVSIVLSTIGTLFMIAMAFSILPAKFAIFAGVTCYILAGMVRKILN